MATKRMLIDATHPEETRVVVVDGNRLEELEFESANRKQLKGNIYLAKVTRVEPSLQAAFVEYGGNRHGFLAFNEIHPDYYQIPVSDREEYEADVDDNGDETDPDPEAAVEESGADDSDQVEHNRPRYRNQRRYKIQEVIKKRQIILVQVVKEERGNKGAALTTYLSLAGRYCVLMPNTDKGGGISRKISNVKDRKRLKSVLADLSIPKGTAVIVRTAGAERTKPEIKRDFEYLMRLWSNIRDVTLQSQAPALIYEEANLIKRSIRDMYSRDIDEVLVEGEEGYRIAKDFMKMLIPSHAKKVQPYREESKIPLYHRYQVEGQLDAMHSAIVQLPSGGYIVINPTEALVAIDVNSGRSTKERNIEETALKTNLEAADEIARSLRLRDLAGLVVVDFIDMEISRNQSAVERRIKEAMKHDRARIQIGRISPFGLLEMSRQRLRPSFTETSTEPCHFCHGTGVRRSLESTVLHVLRVIEEEGIRRRSDEIIVHVPTQVALYILNQKRDLLAAIEERYQMAVQLLGDDSLVSPEYKLERLKAKQGGGDTNTRPLGPEDSTKLENIKDEVLETTSEDDEEGDGRKRRRRRRPRRRKNENQSADEVSEVVENEETGDEDDDEDKPRKRRRRGKRGGRRRSRRTNEDGVEIENEDDDEAMTESSEGEASEKTADEAASEEETREERPRRRPRRRGMRRRRPDYDEPREAKPASDAEETSNTDSETSDAPSQEEEKPKRTRRRISRKSTEEKSEETADTSEDNTEESSEEKPKRKTTRRRTSTRKPKVDEDTSDASESASEEAEEKPKPAPRKRRTTKKEDVAVVEAKEEKAPTPEPKVEAKVIATTAVTLKASDGSHEEVTEDKPKRKGWWSR
ncbi:Ribonuclease E [Candidatus Terasakiella magnetica]|uniref:Ribonuclease E n=1 Tax=Candidatus Terasakiella magnetica TaxID=1867952 RepID=A0A1C3RLF2_9PROT|nr:Rne/Rng family ribonuclease [Candidatus Terasakiella magnetica]SCA58053.1 Ribonuclease E [Candidatus Terasakiella magnetica]